jgi:predicted Ser/Thr protein kinase
MDYSSLNNCNFSDLKKMAKDMGLTTKKSKSEYIIDIQLAFKEYETYKKNKIDKYTRIKQIGNKGKQSIIYEVTNNKNNIFAMKTFKKNKSSNHLKIEYNLQKKASSIDIAPKVIEYDSVSKYIVMEKMDEHLLDVIQHQGTLTKTQQLRILEIFKELDNIGIFHSNPNINNYMIKDNKIYIIDFGSATEINTKLIKLLGTNTPNTKIMTLELINTLIRLSLPSSSWKYLKKILNDEDINSIIK